MIKQTEYTTPDYPKKITAKRKRMKKEKRTDKQIRKENKRRKTWELFYPDGSSSLMNYDPIERERARCLKIIDEIKLTGDEYYFIKELKSKIKGK